ncbi:hypothetical protein BC629DRAFT_865000 [Irpex lacteus]|nr:hypothetical protein BC629DRAFT_865000 [Irpex lacteus]
MPVLISALESVDYIYGDTLFEATVEWLTTGYKHYAGKMRFSGHEGATRNYAYLRRILQSRWLPILELMRSALRSPSFQSRDTAALQRIKQLWEDLGSSYRLSKKSKELDSVETLVGYVKSEEREKGCAWRECACFGRRGVWHRTRRVCKGCWVAVYCCERCQKGDWKLGHRDVCVGRRVLPTE